MRFGIASIMLLTLVCAVMASATNYLLRAVSQGASGKVPFVIATLTLPLVALLGVSLAHGLYQAWRNRPPRG